MTAGKTNTANHGPLTEGAGTANAVTGGVSTQTQAGLSTQLAAGDGVLDVPTQTSTKSDAELYNAAPMPDLSNITDLDIRTHEMLAAQAPARSTVVGSDAKVPTVATPKTTPIQSTVGDGSPVPTQSATTQTSADPELADIIEAGTAGIAGRRPALNSPTQKPVSEPNVEELTEAFKAGVEGRRYVPKIVDNEISLEDDVQNSRQTKVESSKLKNIYQALHENARRNKEGAGAVDWKQIDSDEYRECFNRITTNEKANDSIYRRARWALNNRDAKTSEELYAIDLRTGEEIARITDQNIPFGVKRTKKFDQKLKDAANTDVLLLHNHPNGTPPSIADLNILCGMNNMRGLVVGHNGYVYLYTAPSTEIPKKDFEVAFFKYSRYTNDRIYAHEKALEELMQKYDFVVTKIGG